MKRPIMLVIIATMLIIILASCSSGVAQEQYQKALDDLSNAQSQNQTLQNQLSSAQSQIQALQAQVARLPTQNQSPGSDRRAVDSNVAKAKILADLFLSIMLTMTSSGNPTANHLADMQTQWADSVNTVGDPQLSAKFVIFINPSSTFGEDKSAEDFILYLLTLESNLLSSAANGNPEGPSSKAVVVGSGNVQTRDMALTDFTRIEITDGFQADIIRSDSFLVLVSLDDNLPQYLNVTKSSDTLHIGLKPDTTYVKTNQRVGIMLPSLRYLSVTGVSQTNVSGFNSPDSMEFYLSGAGRLIIKDCTAGDTRLESTGSGQIAGKMATANLKLVLSGGSTIELEGSGGDMSLEASGGSRFSLLKFATLNADLNISGGSEGYINASGTVNADVKDGSHVYYYDSPNLGGISVTGGSTIGTAPAPPPTTPAIPTTPPKTTSPPKTTRP